jgi:hypothetical protein
MARRSGAFATTPRPGYTGRMKSAEIVGVLKGSDAARCEAVLLALQEGQAEVSEPVAVEIVRLLAGPSRALRRRAAGALATGLARGVGEEALAGAMNDRDPERRWGAVFAAAKAGRSDTATYEGALEALAADDGDVRWAAAEIVRRLSLHFDPEGSALARLAASGASNARKMALYILRDLGCSDAGVIEAALGDEAAEVRLAALAAASRLSDPGRKLVAAITGVLERDSQPGVRRAAAAVLGAIAADDPGAREALERARAAAGSLARLRARGEQD